ncbi:hypothetical protein [Streptomyces sp. NPDC049879]|uniref:hypothetical protein n=1 Tax=Streptomyces sp. NPDC049879 TaxID=3365598 RepID=UPI003794B76B
MSEVTFRKTDVEGKLGILTESPWQTRTNFLAEIDTADMELQATSFRRASGEAAEAGSLGRAATKKSTDAGQADGGALVDADERVASSFRGLQSDGEDMETASDVVEKSIALAQETAEKLDALVEGPTGERFTEALDPLFDSTLANAEENWANWREKYATELNGYEPGTGLRVQYGDLVVELYAPDFGPPLALAVRLKEDGIEHVAVAARSAAKEMKDTLAHYRKTLTGYGHELIGMGYDFSGSELSLWTSGEMLDYAVDAINNAKPGDEDAIRPHLTAVEALIAAAEGGRELTRDEAEFLGTFLHRIDDGQLLAISEHATDTSSIYPGMPGWGSVSGTERTSADVLADAVMVLNNPDFHEWKRDFIEAPGGVHLIYPRTHGVDDVRMDPGADDGPEYMKSYDAMTQFLARSDIPPGDLMAERMADSALYTQELYTQHEEYRGGVANPGANRMLELAARNPDTAAGMLADGEFSDRLFDQKWENSSGAAAFVTAGTTYPEGFATDQRDESDYDKARSNVIDVGRTDYDAVRAGRGETPEDMPLDHTDLEAAVQPLLPTYQVPLPPA